ncbi:hypothetical protein [Methylobacter sp. S3L5C]|uniref:hypothetical protein n=1 Tax=Methylobacter sp. S3L5C TaxID=2839024 RepID=UPI001FAC9EFF|nr:hypothetical protein [Methylobacter sp. S3L5C]UOA07659.1 hypothetical protein KKZ03_15515 [Methylobacter sp. S3L5C]
MSQLINITTGFSKVKKAALLMRRHLLGGLKKIQVNKPCLDPFYQIMVAEINAAKAEDRAYIPRKLSSNPAYVAARNKELTALRLARRRQDE